MAAGIEKQGEKRWVRRCKRGREREKMREGGREIERERIKCVCVCVCMCEHASCKSIPERYLESPEPLRALEKSSHQ